ncbi:hypothetical protein [Ralstonia pseudosolanacearum]|uniref:hypothetical protein n=1 Tax=Ralstonia pseudosolanacearum TaxID=1310165 RepID=UPI001FFAEBC0|nr:hypothetical protein [Ralstonia pseudosolanacearum]
MNYSIDQFWKARLGTLKKKNLLTSLQGWHSESRSSSSFVEADLSLRANLQDLSQPIWFIAAAGAVGKSTLAQEICAKTNAVYLDLASAATVAGNYLTGGLVNVELLEAWRAGEVTLLIDALDEARLRVTQASFEDFLIDVASVARGRAMPLILLGRVGIVEEARKFLNDRFGLASPIFDIELFDLEKARRFVWSALDRLSQQEAAGERPSFPHLAGSLASHPSVYRDAIDQLVTHLADVTNLDGRQFVGYAPVLDAVATVIASEPNPVKVPGAVESVLAGKVLNRVTTVVMERESGKLCNQMQERVAGLAATGLYSPQEQLSRLAAAVLGVGTVQLPANLPQTAVAYYEEAVQSLLPQHPFLDTNSPKPASAVFGACIVAAALRSADSVVAKSAERYAQTGAHAPNPFLLDFYRESTDDLPVPAAHVGLLYESLQAKVGAGDVVRLSAEGGSGQEQLDVDMSLVSSEGGEKLYEFPVVPDGPLRFGRRLGGVNIDAEGADVEIGGGGQLELIAPISIRVRSLILTCDELVVKPDSAPDARDQIVFLEAEEALAEIVRGVPLVRAGAILQVAWPDSKVYPWAPFSCGGVEDHDERMAEVQRAFRRLCISFRSHSKGRLARYKGKVEHFRMTKGNLGVALRERLLTDDVLSLEGKMYFLDPDALGEKAEVTFQDLKMKRYSTGTTAYLSKILDAIGT